MSNPNPFMPSIESDAAEVMTADEVGHLLRLRPSTVADLARRGVLPSVKFGRARRYMRCEVQDYINAQRSR